MRTFELLIVFAALMAVIALVAIAIDWVGRPLRNRRFIPRIYRYEDEVQPDPALANPMAATALGGQPAMHAPQSPPLTAPPVMGPPVSMQPPVVATIPAQLAPRAPAADAVIEGHPDRIETRAPLHATPVEATQPTTRSAFSDSLDDADPVIGEANGPGTPTLGGSRPRGIAETIPVAAAESWHPGMPLDARAGERKATTAVKAERFWKAAAANIGSLTHFDNADQERMAEGKAPRRRNPRTGELESMELVGLRAASSRSDVRMKWPDDAVDPWSPS